MTANRFVPLVGTTALLLIVLSTLGVDHTFFQSLGNCIVTEEVRTAKNEITRKWVTIDFDATPAPTPWRSDMIYDGHICPELLEVVRSIENATEDFVPLNVTLFQLEGSWSTEEATSTYHEVFQHNTRMSQRHSYAATSLVNTTQWTTQGPSFAKTLAVKGYCDSNPTTDLVLFLDADVMLMNPYVKVEFLWHHYKQRYPDMEFLFAADNNDLNTGVFMVNCTSPTAMRFLDYWNLYATRTPNWKSVPPELHEQNAIHWLLQTNPWRSQHPRYRRTTKLVRKISEEELQLFSVNELRKRIITIDGICELSTFPIELICDATYNERYFTRGPRWWEEGQFSVHTAGTRSQYRKLPYLKRLLSRNVTIPPASGTSLQDAAREYLTHYESKRSINPPRTVFDAKKCKGDERKANRQANQALAAQGGAPGENTTNATVQNATNQSAENEGNETVAVE